MKASELCHKNIQKSYPNIHKTRLISLMTAVNTACTGQNVSVTGLGRKMKDLSKTTTKHDIKRIDRLIGNQHLHNDRFCFYQYMSKQLIGPQEYPLLIVDWSPIPGKTLFQLLRVSIPMGGRTLTIYEGCFEEKYLNSPKVHQDILEDIALILPETVIAPIFLSDAIFKTPWFDAVEKQGWYWISRVRGQVQLSLNQDDFEGCTSIMTKATSTATLLKDVRYSKATKHACQGVLYHGTIKGRHQKKKRGGISKDGKSRYYADKAKQPWLLVHHLPEKLQKAPKIIQLYRYRMQIEEGFRDTKSHHYGIGLSHAHSRSTQRYDNLLLIASLALFLLWCIGKAAVNKNIHYQLQSNTERKRVVLSHIFLAIQIINDRRYLLELSEIKVVF